MGECVGTRRPISKALSGQDLLHKRSSDRALEAQRKNRLESGRLHNYIVGLERRKVLTGMACHFDKAAMRAALCTTRLTSGYVNPHFDGGGTTQDPYGGSPYGLTRLSERRLMRWREQEEDVQRTMLHPDIVRQLRPPWDKDIPSQKRETLRNILALIGYDDEQVKDIIQTLEEPITQDPEVKEERAEVTRPKPQKRHAAKTVDAFSPVRTSTETTEPVNFSVDKWERNCLDNYIDKVEFSPTPMKPNRNFIKQYASRTAKPVLLARFVSQGTNLNRPGSSPGGPRGEAGSLDNTVRPITNTATYKHKMRPSHIKGPSPKLELGHGNKPTTDIPIKSALSIKSTETSGPIPTQISARQRPKGGTRRPGVVEQPQLPSRKLSVTFLLPAKPTTVSVKTGQQGQGAQCRMSKKYAERETGVRMFVIGSGEQVKDTGFATGNTQGSTIPAITISEENDKPPSTSSQIPIITDIVDPVPLGYDTKSSVADNMNSALTGDTTTLKQSAANNIETKSRAVTREVPAIAVTSASVMDGTTEPQHGAPDTMDTERQSGPSGPRTENADVVDPAADNEDTQDDEQPVMHHLSQWERDLRVESPVGLAGDVGAGVGPVMVRRSERQRALEHLVEQHEGSVTKVVRKEHFRKLQRRMQVYMALRRLHATVTGSKQAQETAAEKDVPADTNRKPAPPARRNSIILNFVRQQRMSQTKWHFGALPWFSMKMQFYQYRKSHCRDKTILISTMGFPILVRCHIYIKSVPRMLKIKYCHDANLVAT